MDISLLFQLAFVLVVVPLVLHILPPFASDFPEERMVFRILLCLPALAPHRLHLSRPALLNLEGHG